MMIRPFVEHDMERVLELAVTAWEPVMRGYLDVMGTEMFHTYHSSWEQRLKNEVCDGCRRDSGVTVSIVDIEGRITAFIGYQINAESKCGQIWYNAVDPAYQGRGIATAMYQFVLDQMRTQHIRYASVITGGDTAHLPARKAYEKAGFTKQIPSVRYYMELVSTEA